MTGSRPPNSTRWFHFAYIYLPVTYRGQVARDWVTSFHPPTGVFILYVCSCLRALFDRTLAIYESIWQLINDLACASNPGYHIICFHQSHREIRTQNVSFLKHFHVFVCPYYNTEWWQFKKIQQVYPKVSDNQIYLSTIFLSSNLEVMRYKHLNADERINMSLGTYNIFSQWFFLKWKISIDPIVTDTEIHCGIYWIGSHRSALSCGLKHIRSQIKLWVFTRFWKSIGMRKTKMCW